VWITDRDDVVSSVEERRRVVVIEVARVERRAEGGHVVLGPLPHVASHVAKPETVGRVRVNRLSVNHTPHHALIHFHAEADDASLPAMTNAINRRRFYDFDAVIQAFWLNYLLT